MNLTLPMVIINRLDFVYKFRRERVRRCYGENRRVMRGRDWLNVFISDRTKLKYWLKRFSSLLQEEVLIEWRFLSEQCQSGFLSPFLLKIDLFYSSNSMHRSIVWYVYWSRWEEMNIKVSVHIIHIRWWFNNGDINIMIIISRWYMISTCRWSTRWFAGFQWTLRFFYFL